MFLLQLFITILSVLKELTSYFVPILTILHLYIGSASSSSAQPHVSQMRFGRRCIYIVSERKQTRKHFLSEEGYVCLNCFSPCIPMCSVRYFFSLKTLVCLSL